MIVIIQTNEDLEAGPEFTNSHNAWPLLQLLAALGSPLGEVHHKVMDSNLAFDALGDAETVWVPWCLGQNSKLEAGVLHEEAVLGKKRRNGV